MVLLGFSMVFSRVLWFFYGFARVLLGFSMVFLGFC